MGYVDIVQLLHVVEAAALIGRMRSVAPGAKILVGGVAFRRDPSLADATGADACVADPWPCATGSARTTFARPVPVPAALRAPDAGDALGLPGDAHPEIPLRDGNSGVERAFLSALAAAAEIRGL